MAFFQPNAMLYTQGFGSATNSLSVPHLDVRAPTVTDLNGYGLGKTWLNYVTGDYYVLGNLSVSNGVTQANWIFLELPQGI